MGCRILYFLHIIVSETTSSFICLYLYIFPLCIYMCNVCVCVLFGCDQFSYLVHSLGSWKQSWRKSKGRGLRWKNLWFRCWACPQLVATIRCANSRARFGYHRTVETRNWLCSEGDIPEAEELWLLVFWLPSFGCVSSSSTFGSQLMWWRSENPVEFKHEDVNHSSLFKSLFASIFHYPPHLIFYLGHEIFHDWCKLIGTTKQKQKCDVDCYGIFFF